MDNGIVSLENVNLADDEVVELLAFLAALTDPCETDADCLASWMPSDQAIDPDGQQLNAYLTERSR